MQVGPSFSPHQPVMFNPQATPVPQQFFHPNGPQVCQFFGYQHICVLVLLLLHLKWVSEYSKISSFLMQYGQQMMIGPPRQVVYMPNYPAVRNI